MEISAIVNIVEGGNNKYLLFLYDKSKKDRVTEQLYDRFGYSPDNQTSYNGSSEKIMQNLRERLDRENIYYIVHKDACLPYVELEIHCKLPQLEGILLLI